jgi:8-oxo-dGTP diphosphatase
MKFLFSYAAIYASLIIIYVTNAARLAFSLPLGRGGYTEVRVVLMRGNDVLLVRPRFAPGVWTLPGGGVQKNESPEQAAIREVNEETGLHVLSLVEISTETRLGQGTAHIYRASDVAGIVAEATSLEIIGKRWADKNNLPRAIVPSHKRWIQKAPQASEGEARQA